MWSARHGKGLAAAAIALSALSACTIRPLYSGGASGNGPQADLPAIAIDQPVTREEQVFRNALNFDLRGGGEGAAIRYHLSYRLVIREREVAVERRTGTPSAYQLDASVSFLVEDTTTGAQIVGANVTAIDSYNRVSQDFANVRARRDAEDRLLTTLAQLTQARLAAFFSTR